MLLYHGTSETRAKRILRDGILPRSSTKISNWEGSPSHNRGVYLTDAYPLYFAIQATDDGDQCAVVEVDTDALDHAVLAPDEDVLEQNGRGLDDVSGDMKKRTAWYRRRLHMYAGGGQWEISLRAMGEHAAISGRCHGRPSGASR